MMAVDYIHNSSDLVSIYKTTTTSKSYLKKSNNVIEATTTSKVFQRHSLSCPRDFKTAYLFTH